MNETEGEALRLIINIAGVVIVLGIFAVVIAAIAYEAA
jgi:hypothetical protein